MDNKYGKMRDNKATEDGEATVEVCQKKTSQVDWVSCNKKEKIDLEIHL